MICSCKEPRVLYAATEGGFQEKHCVDCKYINIDTHYCHRFTSLVTGKVVALSCRQARADDNICGHFAFFYEPKEETHVSNN